MAIGREGHPGIARAREFSARAFGDSAGDCLGPSTAAILREIANEAARTAIAPAILLMPDEQVLRRRVDRYPGLDRCIGKEHGGWTERRLLLGHVVGDAG